MKIIQQTSKSATKNRICYFGDLVWVHTVCNKDFKNGPADYIAGENASKIC